MATSGTADCRLPTANWLRGAHVVLGGAALLGVTIAGDAAADQKKECVSAYEQTQALRKEGQLRKAREQAVTCAQDACPSVVKKDCAEWLPQIEASTPTVVFEARDATGQDTSDVRVSFDGALLKERLDGKAVPVDPGQHTIRYELAGADPIEETIVVREGEKNRKLVVSFAKGAPAGPAEAATTDADTGEGGVPTIAWVLGGVGIVGIGAFATFGLLGRSQKGDLEDTCAPSCSEDEVDSVRTKLILADVSLGVGIVSLGVATYLIVTAPPSKPSSASSGVRFDLAPTRGGGFATVAGAF